MNDSFGGGNFNTTTSGGAQSEPKAEGVIPVFIKQILESPEGNFQMWDMTFGMVSTVAIVRGIDTSSTKITYTLEDHTGTIEAHYWLEEGDTLKSPDVMLNNYARVYGTLRQHGVKKNIMIFKMLPVQGINELTTHMLEVLNARYKAEEYSKKGTGGEISQFGETSEVGNFSIKSDENTMGLEGKQLAVFQAIDTHGTAVGISMQELQRKFSHISAKELQSITDFMTTEGHVYTSIDSEHFLATDR